MTLFSLQLLRSFLLIPCFLMAIFFTNFSLFAFDPFIILVGPPGSGKGTLSQHLKINYGYHHISIGDVLRYEVDMQTDLGLSIEKLIKSGDYVDSKIIHTILANNIKKYLSEPLILDGFGRNKEDVDVIHQLLIETGQTDRTLVIYLEALDQVCQERISHRLVCSGCGFVYNSETAKPQIHERCNLCGMTLKSRLNDTTEIIMKRIQNYRENVASSYQYAASLFPTIMYHSNGSCEECTHFYDSFSREAAKSDTDSVTFVKSFTMY